MPPTSSTAGLPSKFKLLLSLVLLLPLGAVSQSADPTSLITGADAIAPSLVLTAIMSDGQRTVMSGDIVPTESPRPGGDEKPDTTPSPWTGEDEAADSTPPPQPSPSPGEDEKPSTTLPPQFTRDPGQDEEPDATPSPQSSRSSGQNEKPNVTLLPPPPPGQDLKPDTKPSPQPTPSSRGDEGRPMASDGQGSSAPQSTAAEPYQEGAPGLDRTTPTPPVVAPPQPSSPSGRNTAGPAVTNAATPYSPAKTQAPQVQTPGAPSQAPGVSGTESGPSASRANTQAAPKGSDAPAASEVLSGSNALSATATGGVGVTSTDAANGEADATGTSAAVSVNTPTDGGTATLGVDATSTDAAVSGTTPTDGAATTVADNESPSGTSSTPAEFTGSSERRAVWPGCGAFLGLMGLALVFF